jgi:hypothetical protein
MSLEQYFIFISTTKWNPKIYCEQHEVMKIERGGINTKPEKMTKERRDKDREDTESAGGIQFISMFTQ